MANLLCNSTENHCGRPTAGLSQTRVSLVPDTVTPKKVFMLYWFVLSDQRSPTVGYVWPTAMEPSKFRKIGSSWAETCLWFVPDLATSRKLRSLHVLQRVYQASRFCDLNLRQSCAGTEGGSEPCSSFLSLVSNMPRNTSTKTYPEKGWKTCRKHSKRRRIFPAWRVPRE